MADACSTMRVSGLGFAAGQQGALSLKHAMSINSSESNSAKSAPPVLQVAVANLQLAILACLAIACALLAYAVQGLCSGASRR